MTTPIFELIRLPGNVDQTFGVLVDTGKVPFAVTIEPPWQGNRENMSCIPSGFYLCREIVSPRFGETFEVVGVKDRTNIIFHAGNTVSDTKGCIVVGEKFGKLNGKPAVLGSRKALHELINEKLEDVAEFWLLIREAKN